MPKPEGSARDSERFAQEGETLSQAVRRVVDYWHEHQSEGCFNEYPDALMDQHPEIFGELDKEQLGVLCALVWIYLGEGVNKNLLLNWFNRALAE